MKLRITAAVILLPILFSSCLKTDELTYEQYMCGTFYISERGKCIFVNDTFPDNNTICTYNIANANADGDTAKDTLRAIITYSNAVETGKNVYDVVVNRYFPFMWRTVINLSERPDTLHHDIATVQNVWISYDYLTIQYRYNFYRYAMQHTFYLTKIEDEQEDGTLVLNFHHKNREGIAGQSVYTDYITVSLAEFQKLFPESNSFTVKIVVGDGDSETAHKAVYRY